MSETEAAYAAMFRQFEAMRDDRDDLRARLVAVEAEFTGAREDIRARKREFTRLGADREYLNALDDSFGLVANRLRAALAKPSATEDEKGTS